MTTKDTNPKDAIGTKKWRQFMTVPRQVLWEVGVGMLEGALKYGRHNYRASGVRASVYVDAAIGHLDQFIEGEDIDKDSGLPHVTKAICSLVVLRDAMLNDFWVDDRPPKIKDIDALRDRLQSLVEQNFERHADKNPHHYTELEDGAPYHGHALTPLINPSPLAAESWSQEALRRYRESEQAREMLKGSEHVIGEPVTAATFTPGGLIAGKDLEIGKFYRAAETGTGVKLADTSPWKIIDKRVDGCAIGVRSNYSKDHKGIALSKFTKWEEVAGWEEQSLGDRHRAKALAQAFERVKADPTWLPTDPLYEVLGNDDPQVLSVALPKDREWDTVHVAEGLTSKQLTNLTWSELRLVFGTVDAAVEPPYFRAAMRRVLIRIKSQPLRDVRLLFADGGVSDRRTRLTDDQWMIAVPGVLVTEI